MKYYRLLKDLPTFKAGDKFHIDIPTGNLVCDKNGVTAYARSTLTQFPNILEDWFEKIKDDWAWKPAYSDRYYCIGGDGRVGADCFVETEADKGRCRIGNCFKTEEDARRAAEWLKAFKILRDDTKGFKADGVHDAYYVYYEDSGSELYLGVGPGVNSPITFGTGEDALESAEKHRKEWLTLLGVEESE